MTAPILVTGGTGTIGGLVVPLLQEHGERVRVLSRRAAGAAGAEVVRADLATGEGLPGALLGVRTVVHLAGTAKGDDEKMRHLVDAGRRAGVEHVVFSSVVGTDRVEVASRLDRAMFGYFAAKRAAEQVLEGSGMGWSTLRATQVQESLLAVCGQLSRLPVVVVPAGTRFQPVAAAEVAQRLVELALGGPAGLVPDLAGPRAYLMQDLVRAYLDAHDRRRPVLPVRMPGRAARSFRDGANLNLDRAVGRRTWEEALRGGSAVTRPAGPAPSRPRR